MQGGHHQVDGIAAGKAASIRWVYASLPQIKRTTP
jgi:hypothetical protein